MGIETLTLQQFTASEPAFQALHYRSNLQLFPAFLTVLR
jgi:hypothetical protein